MLLIQPSSYRGGRFVAAARRLGLDAIRVFDLPRELAEDQPDRLAIDFRDIPESVAWIEAYHRHDPVDAILSVDDGATELAARANERVGLPANDPQAAEAARDKLVMRRALDGATVNHPWFRAIALDADPEPIALELDYPVVVKARRLSGSRGVIRANDGREFVQAFHRVRRIIGEEAGDDDTRSLLVEEYLPGIEVAVEGLLTDGDLQVLAIFDKPDPLEGPFFEETIYTTPSRLPDHVQQVIAHETALACRALGLRHGPIHAELRVKDERAWLLEVAGRSIGGL